jgi:hypothetical protein
MPAAIAKPGDTDSGRREEPPGHVLDDRIGFEPIPRTLQQPRFHGRHLGLDVGCCEYSVAQRCGRPAKHDVHLVDGLRDALDREAEKRVRTARAKLVRSYIFLGESVRSTNRSSGGPGR